MKIMLKTSKQTPIKTHLPVLQVEVGDGKVGVGNPLPECEVQFTIRGSEGALTVRPILGTL